MLVRVHACALDALDLKVRKGFYRKFVRPPSVPGYQVSGVIREVGADVEGLEAGDEVVAVCALDAVHGGCAELVAVDGVNVCRKPELVTHEQAAASLNSGVAAYTAFHYQARLRPGDTVLVLPGRFASDTMAVQLAGLLGAKVIVAAATSEQYNVYGDCGPHVARVIDLGSESVVDIVKKETGDIGVDCVLDLQEEFVTLAGDTDHSLAAELQAAEDAEAAAAAGDDDGPSPSAASAGETDAEMRETAAARGAAAEAAEAARAARELAEGTSDEAPFVSKTDIIRCLAVQGQWVTRTPDLQLDPPESRQLHMRCASLGFLFPEVWLMAPTQHGRYMHMLRDVMDKVASGQLTPMVQSKMYPVDKIRQAHRDVQSGKMGNVVIRFDVPRE